MKKHVSRWTVVAIALLLILVPACSLSDRDQEESEASSQWAEQEAPSSQEPSRESSGSSSQPEESKESSSAQSESHGEAGTSGQNPATQEPSSQAAVNSAPEIDGSKFYQNDGGSSSTIIIQGVGRYDLDYETAAYLYGMMSFSDLTPSDKAFEMELYSTDPGINFSSPDFSHELRMDKTTGNAMYQVNSTDTYYYTFTDDAYEFIVTFVQDVCSSAQDGVE